MPRGTLGYVSAMPDHEPAADERVAARSELLPEEESAGSDDPAGQAEAILADSDERTLSRERSAGEVVEHRTSEDVTP